MGCFPAAATLWVLHLLGKLPLFSYAYERHASTGVKRPGFADGYSVGRLSFAGNELFAKRIESGPELSAYHFYLARPVRNYLRCLPVLPYRSLTKRGRVLEIGCGAGRMLGAFLDCYGGNGVGIDFYEPAIEVGKVSVIRSEIEFQKVAIASGDEVQRTFPEIFSIVMFSSALTHITRDNGCRLNLLRRLMQQSLCIVGHERNTPDLLDDLHVVGIQIAKQNDYITFEWLAPNCIT